MYRTSAGRDNQSVSQIGESDKICINKCLLTNRYRETPFLKKNGVFFFPCHKTTDFHSLRRI